MSAVVRIPQSTFVRGELSPLMDGHFNSEFYFQGASIIEGFVTLPGGAVTQKPGTFYGWNS